MVGRGVLSIEEACANQEWTDGMSSYYSATREYNLGLLRHREEIVRDAAYA